MFRRLWVANKRKDLMNYLTSKPQLKRAWCGQDMPVLVLGAFRGSGCKKGLNQESTLRLERRHQTGPWHSKPHNFWRWPFHKKLLMANLFVFIRWISLPYALWRETAIFNSYEPLNRQNRPFWPQNHTIFKSLFLFRIKELAQSVAGKLESLAWSLIVRTWNFLMGTSNPVK